MEFAAWGLVVFGVACLVAVVFHEIMWHLKWRKMNKFLADIESKKGAKINIGSDGLAREGGIVSDAMHPESAKVPRVGEVIKIRGGSVMAKAKKSAKEKYADGTTYKDSDGKTRRRVSSPGTKRGDAYCARTVSQKRTAKVKVRRAAWGCQGKKSVKK